LIENVNFGDNGLRDEVLVRLTFECGLRAQECAGLQWKRHILTASGKVGAYLRITSDIAKGENNRIVEREIPISSRLKRALENLRARRPEDQFVIYALANHRKFTNGWKNRAPKGACDPNALAQYVRRLYAAHSYKGMTSHSGRRTFITVAGRTANKHGASIRDVQLLAGHRSLETTASYIEPSEHANKLVEGLYE
jgi:integrase/recombinase XerD